MAYDQHIAAPAPPARCVVITLSDTRRTRRYQRPAPFRDTYRRGHDFVAYRLIPDEAAELINC